MKTVNKIQLSASLPAERGQVPQRASPSVDSFSRSRPHSSEPEFQVGHNYSSACMSFNYDQDKGLQVTVSDYKYAVFSNLMGIGLKLKMIQKLFTRDLASVACWLKMHPEFHIKYPCKSQEEKIQILKELLGSCPAKADQWVEI